MSLDASDADGGDAGGRACRLALDSARRIPRTAGPDHEAEQEEEERAR
jgi:hypothetical protein